MSEVSKNALDFSRSGKINTFMGFVHKVNSLIGDTFGKDAMYNLKPKENLIGKTFKFEDSKSKFNGRDIVINATIPSEEIFSLAQELVRPADEPFSAREALAVDDSFHVGSREVGFDVLSQNGRALLRPAGNSNGNETPKSDISLGRNLSAVGKIDTYMEVSRDELQALDLRNDRGMGPLVDLMSEKLTTARKSVSRVEDQLVWQGGSFDDSAETNEIPGLLDSFSTTSSLYEGNNPSKGKRAQVVDPGAGRAWSTKTADQIITDIRTAAEYVTRNGVYVPNTMILPRSILTSISLLRTSDTDSTPLIEWIRRAFSSAYGLELKIVGTNALTTLTGPVDGFILIDSRKEHQAIASVEALTVLPSVTEKDGTIKQVVQMKTGGCHVKHPAAGYLGTDI
jgi:hypothetical protein